MKRVLSVLVAMAAVVMMMAGCSSPLESADGAGSAALAAGSSGRAITGSDQIIYLKGSGNNFSESGWSPVFRVAEAEIEADYALGKTPETWHLVYTGNDFEAVSFMQITFTNGEVFSWTPDMGPSLNGGGNNPGWVIQAPYGWKIAYIDKGNNNESGSFLITAETGNLNFNISGYKAGTSTTPIPPDPPDPPEPPVPPVKGKVEFVKTVKGIEGSILNWASASSIDALITGFKLYKAEKDGGALIGLPTFKNMTSGSVLFDNLDDGWYAVEEILTVEGRKVFEEHGLQYFLITNGITFGGADFEYDAFYKIVSGYGGGYTLGYEGLNNTGDVFPIAIKNAATGITYPSFCANAGSVNFAGEGISTCSGYMVAAKNQPNGVNYADFVMAYNYIEGKYGKLNDLRPVTQIVTWILLGAIDINSPAFNTINWTKVGTGGATVAGVPDAKAMVLDIIKNFRSYKESGIVDVVFMVCDNGSEDHYRSCQPQLVPIYGKRLFQNIVKPVIKEGGLTVKAKVLTKYYEITKQKVYQYTAWDIYCRNVWDIYERDVWDIYQKTYQDIYAPVFEKVAKGCKDNLVTKGCNSHNGCHYIAIDVDAAKKKTCRYEMASYNDKNKGNGCYYNVSISGSKMNICFDNNFKSGKYSACVVNSPSHFSNNTPRHHSTGKSCSFDLPAGHGKTVYLHFNIEGGSEWYTHNNSNNNNNISYSYEFKEWRHIDTVYYDAEKVGQGHTEYVKIGQDSTEYKKTGEGKSASVLLKTVELSKKLITETADLQSGTLVVTNAKGEVVYNGAYRCGTVVDLPVGTYTVRFYGDGFNKSGSVTIEADKVANLDFGTVRELSGSDVIKWAADVTNRIVTASVYNTITIAAVKNDNKKEDVILEELKKLDDKYLGSRTNPNDPNAIIEQ